MDVQAIILLVVVGGTALSLLGYAIKMNAARRSAVRRLTEGKGNIVDGQVTAVVGTVRAGDPTLDAPVSGKTCVLYKVIVFVHVEGEDEQPPPILRIGIVPFELETRHGVIRVEASVVDAVMAPRAVIPRKLEREAAFAREIGLEGETMRDLSFEEACVEVGDKIAVQGRIAIEGAKTYLRADPGTAITVGES